MAGTKILVVEDEVDVVTAVEKGLSYPEYKISAIVASGAEALQAITAQLPDVALVELNLHGEMDGIDTGQAIQARLDIPIVYLTAFIDENLLERAKRSDPFGLVFVPFQERELYAAIEIALFRHRQQQELKLAEIERDLRPLTGTGEDLRTSEAKLKTIFDNSLQGFILFGRNGRVQACNKIAGQVIRQVMGVQATEGSHIREIVPETNWDEFKRDFDQALAGETVRAEMFVNINNGRWLEFNFIPVFADDRQVVGVCMSAVDIDTHKRAIDALAASEERLLAEVQSLLFSTAALVSDVDLGNMLDFITSQARYLTNADGAAILLLSDDKQYLEIVHLSQFGADSQLPGMGSLVELIMADREIYSNHDISNDKVTASLRRLLDATARSVLYAPLKVQSEMLGMLLIWSRPERAFVDRDTRLIRLLADQAALALYNARWHIQSRRLAIEQERRRIARELHDSVTQALYSIGMAALASLKYLDSQATDKLRDAISYIHTLSQAALKDMRQHIQDLRSTTLAEKELGEALRQYCDILDRKYELKVELLVDADLQLAPYFQENLYYIAREALWNVVKHAGVSQAKLVLQRDEDHVLLVVTDKGTGFISSHPSKPDSAGLRGIKERVALLGGILELQSGPGRGTELMVRVPV